jgi:hypothetical protein
MLYNFYSDYRVFEMGIKLEAVFCMGVICEKIRPAYDIAS